MWQALLEPAACLQGLEMGHYVLRVAELSPVPADYVAGRAALAPAASAGEAVAGFLVAGWPVEVD